MQELYFTYAKRLGDTSMESPSTGGQIHTGLGKICDFRQITDYTSKTVHDRHKVSIKHEQKVVYGLCLMVTLPMTMGDHSHPKSPLFHVFQLPSYLWNG